jgi:hypothetical protein
LVKGGSDVFEQGGFDLVIGDPPHGATFSKEELNYVLNTHPVDSKFTDKYFSFIIKAKAFLNP